MDQGARSPEAGLGQPRSRAALGRCRQAPWDRAHFRGDRERQPDGMSGRRTRVLPDDQDANCCHRAGERPQDVRPAGRYERLAASSPRRKSPIAAIRSASCERLGPVRGHEPASGRRSEGGSMPMPGSATARLRAEDARIAADRPTRPPDRPHVPNRAKNDGERVSGRRWASRTAFTTYLGRSMRSDQAKRRTVQPAATWSFCRCPSRWKDFASLWNACPSISTARRCAGNARSTSDHLHPACTR